MSLEKRFRHFIDCRCDDVWGTLREDIEYARTEEDTGKLGEMLQEKLSPEIFSLVNDCMSGRNMMESIITERAYRLGLNDGMRLLLNGGDS